MLPPLPDWIVHLNRMSGKSVTASRSITPQALSCPVALRPAADGLTHDAVRPVAAHDVLGADADLGAVAAAKGDQRPAVVGTVRDLRPRRPRGRSRPCSRLGELPCELQQEVQQPGLVDDDVRELREPVAHVLGTRPKRVIREGSCRVRPPEVGLVDPVGLVDHLARPDRRPRTSRRCGSSRRPPGRPRSARPPSPPRG